MACFLVPGAEAVVVTAVAQVVKTQEKKKEAAGVKPAETAIPLSQKLRWLYTRCGAAYCCWPLSICGTGR